MIKTGIFAVLLVVTSAGVAIAQTPQADDSLKTPRLTIKPDQKMLVVEAKGDPNTA